MAVRVERQRRVRVLVQGDRLAVVDVEAVAARHVGAEQAGGDGVGDGHRGGSQPVARLVRDAAHGRRGVRQRYALRAVVEQAAVERKDELGRGSRDA